MAALDSGIEVRGLTKSKCTPLHLAAEANFLELVEYLIERQISNVGDLDEVINISHTLQTLIKC
jgi:hypothetical protein